MSDRTLEVWVGPKIIYLYGTVNGEAATFTVIGDGYWQATVPRTDDDNYQLHLEAYSESGLEGTYNYTLFYGMITPVTDRTEADVRNKADKGFYTCVDLNRVNHNSLFLGGLLNDYGYSVVIIGFTPVPSQTFTDSETGEQWTIPYHTEWIIWDLPNETTAGNYLADLTALKTAFYGTTELPASMTLLDYKAANNIELLQAEILTYIRRMELGFRKCGTFKSGQGVILP